jgi:hypothetical protein
MEPMLYGCARGTGRIPLGLIAALTLLAFLAGTAPGTAFAQETLISITGRVVGVVPAGPGPDPPGGVKHLPAGTAASGGRTVRYPAGAYLLRAGESLPGGPMSPADLLLRDGTLQFLPLKEYDLGDVEIGDINGDGLADIVFSIARYECDSIPGTVPRVWMQDSAHRFIDETAARIPPLSTSTFDIDLFDAEGDGDTDILLCGYSCPPSRSSATLLINNGAGVFTDETAWRILAVPEFNILSFAEPARIDSDGRDDIIAIMQNLSDPLKPVWSPILLMNTGDGHFWPDIDGRLPPGGTYGHFNVEADDLTGDGLVDLLFLNISSPSAGLDGQPALFRNTGDGFMADETASRLGSDSLRSTRDVAIADVDGDGDRDLLDVGFFYSSNVPQVRLFRNDGGGFFSQDSGGALAGLSAWFNDAEFAPILHDTLPDIFLARIEVGQQAEDVFMANAGSGTFSVASEQLPAVADFTVAAAVRDHDLDGDVDIVIGNSSPVLDSPGQNRLYVNQRYSPPTEVEDAPGLPGATRLWQNYPNPFNPSTVIRYSLAGGRSVTLTAVNLIGEEVLSARLGYLPPGTHEFAWDAGDLPAGVYFFTVIADGRRAPPRAALLLK